MKKESRENKLFSKLCRMPQKALKAYLVKELNMIEGDGYAFYEGTFPVLLTAHMDTVHVQPVQTAVIYKNKNGNDCISSPQGIGGDDRCGVYIILRILKRTEFRPAILFCEGEEDGGIGSHQFAQSCFIDDLKKLKFFIELDRGNANDLVYYYDENIDFHDWCAEVTGYKENDGSFSDISVLCPATGIAGVNISCGYYHAHTLSEYVCFPEMLATVQAVKKLLERENEVEQFEYNEVKFNYANWFSRYDIYDEYDIFNRGKFSKGYKTTTSKEFSYDPYSLCIVYKDKKGQEVDDYITGNSINECMGRFFVDHPDVCFNDVIDWDWWT